MHIRPSTLLFAFAMLLFIFVMPSSAAAESSKILTCTVTGDSRLGERVVELSIVPPKDDERLNLWALTNEHKPGVLIREAVGVGSVQVDYGGHIERRDLIFLNIGNENGSSHVAFWLREGVFQHPNFVIIDVWAPDIPIRLMESVESQPYLTGNCR